MKASKEKETQKLQRQEFLEAQKLRDEETKTQNEVYLEQQRLGLVEYAEKKTLSKLSDREIQVQMLNATKNTNGWIIFIGVVTLINVIGAIITVGYLYYKDIIF